MRHVYGGKGGGDGRWHAEQVVSSFTPNLKSKLNFICHGSVLFERATQIITVPCHQYFPTQWAACEPTSACQATQQIC